MTIIQHNATKKTVTKEPRAHREYTEVERVTVIEKGAVGLFRAFVRQNAEVLKYVAHWGDGYAGYLAEIVCEELGINRTDATPTYTKKRISRTLATRVFERDAYRCLICSGYSDLCCDHIVPESKGGEATLDNLQTLCRKCNTSKHDKMPSEWTGREAL